MNAKERQQLWYQNHKHLLKPKVPVIVPVEIQQKIEKATLLPDDLRKNANCPQCGGLACFRRYVNNETGELYPEWVGSCTKQKCNYNYSAGKHYRFENKKAPILTIQDYLNSKDDDD